MVFVAPRFLVRPTVPSVDLFLPRLLQAWQHPDPRLVPFQQDFFSEVTEDTPPWLAAHHTRQAWLQEAAGDRSVDTVHLRELVDSRVELGRDHPVLSNLHWYWQNTPDLDPYRQVRLMGPSVSEYAAGFGLETLKVFDVLLRGALRLSGLRDERVVVDFLLINEVLRAAFGGAALQLFFGHSDDPQNPSVIAERDFNGVHIYGGHIIAVSPQLSQPASDRFDNGIDDMAHDLGHLIHAFVQGFPPGAFSSGPFRTPDYYDRLYELVVTHALVGEVAYECFDDSVIEGTHLRSYMRDRAEFLVGEVHSNSVHHVTNYISAVYSNVLFFADDLQKGSPDQAQRVVDAVRNFLRILRKRISGFYRSDPHAKDLEVKKKLISAIARFQSSLSRKSKAA